jgi:hypothetical protein
MRSSLKTRKSISGLLIAWVGTRVALQEVADLIDARGIDRAMRRQRTFRCVLLYLGPYLRSNRPTRAQLRYGNRTLAEVAIHIARYTPQVFWFPYFGEDLTGAGFAICHAGTTDPDLRVMVIAEPPQQLQFANASQLSVLGSIGQNDKEIVAVNDWYTGSWLVRQAKCGRQIAPPDDSNYPTLQSTVFPLPAATAVDLLNTRNALLAPPSNIRRRR